MQHESEPVSPVEAIARLSFAVAALLEARAAAVELSTQQARLLGILRDRQPTINELAAHLGVDKSSISGAVVRAERRGLVIRFPDDRDGRSVRVRLQPAGRALVDAAAAEFEADVERLLSRLTARQRAEWTDLTLRMIDSDREG